MHLTLGAPPWALGPFASCQYSRQGLLPTDAAGAPPQGLKEIGEVILGRAETSVCSGTPPQSAMCPFSEKT